MDQPSTTVTTGSNGSGKNNKLNLSIDLRLVLIALVLVIIGMLAIWRPWVAEPTSSSRTISVTGDATIKAAPDEFTFSPSYDFKEADKAKALSELQAKQTEVVAGLKKLGVADSAIKADSSGYNYDYYYDTDSKTYNYTLNLTITLNNQTLTQKVQDYLVTTSPTGSVSPDAAFSTATQKKLESQGRDAATKDARAKAEQSAQNLGFGIGKVKSVTDDNGSGNFGGCAGGGLCMGANTLDSASPKTSLSVQSGQNDLSYSVSVVYYVK